MTEIARASRSIIQAEALAWPKDHPASHRSVIPALPDVSEL
jgi:hypothetical protein